MEELTATDARYILAIIMVVLAVLIPLLGYIFERMVRGIFRRRAPEWLKILRRSFSRPLRMIVFTFFAGIGLLFLPAVGDREWLSNLVNDLLNVIVILCGNGHIAVILFHNMLNAHHAVAVVGFIFFCGNGDAVPEFQRIGKIVFGVDGQHPVHRAHGKMNEARFR